MYARFQKDSNIKVNVGAIGFVGFHKARLRAAICGGQAKTGTNKSDRKRDRKNRWR